MVLNGGSRDSALRGVSTAEFLVAMGLLAVVLVYLGIFSKQISELDRATRAGDFIANNKSSVVPFVSTDQNGEVHIRPDLVFNSLDATLLQAYEAMQGNDKTKMVLALRLDPANCPASFSANSDSTVPRCPDPNDGGAVKDCCRVLDNGTLADCTAADVTPLLTKLSECYQGFPAISMLSISGDGWERTGAIQNSNTPTDKSAQPSPFPKPVIVSGGGSQGGFISWNRRFDGMSCLDRDFENVSVNIPRNINSHLSS